MLGIAAMGLLTGCGSKVHYEYREQGIEKLNQQEYGEAKLLFEQALDNSSSRVSDFQLDVLKYKAEAEYQLEDYQSAADSYTSLIETDGEKQDYLIRRSLAFLGTGQLDAAMDDYTRAFAMGGEAANLKAAVLKLGEALVDSQQVEKAVILFEQVVKNDINDAELLNQIGQVLLEHKQYHQAGRYFEQATLYADGVTLRQAEFNRAAAYVYEQQYEKALDLFEKYQQKYGYDEAVEKEITFLKSR